MAPLKTPHNGWFVGQRVIAISSDRRSTPRHLVIAKIGRRWADLVYPGLHMTRAGRFDVNTATMDNGGVGASGRVYASQAEFDLACYKDAVSRAARNAWTYSKDPSLKTMEAVATELGVDLATIRKTHNYPDPEQGTPATSFGPVSEYDLAR